MHDTKAFISKGFKSTAEMAIKVKLNTYGTNPSHFVFPRKILRIINKIILKKSNSFWLKFKSELRIKLFKFICNGIFSGSTAIFQW